MLCSWGRVQGNTQCLSGRAKVKCNWRDIKIVGPISQVHLKLKVPRDDLVTPTLCAQFCFFVSCIGLMAIL